MREIPCGRGHDTALRNGPSAEGSYTDNMRLIEELREHNDQMQAAAQQMNEQIALLNAALAEKQRFVNMVIHDLRHPVTSIRTALYIVENDPDPALQEEYLSIIAGRVSALTTLINELTEYHQIEAVSGQLKIERIDLSALIRDCVGNFTPILAGSGITIDHCVETALASVATDGAKLTHILLNLLSNALKSAPSGTIAVRARREGADHWSLTVEDNGCGMTAEEQAHAFEEFYQGERPCQRGDGSGLGLSIVMQMCKALHGEVELRSDYGHGACFRLVFPIPRVTLAAEEPG